MEKKAPWTNFTFGTGQPTGGGGTNGQKGKKGKGKKGGSGGTGYNASNNSKSTAGHHGKKGGFGFGAGARIQKDGSIGYRDARKYFEKL